MGKKTRPFINKKLAQSFHLTHTANHDDYSEDDQENTDHSDDITIDARGHEPGEAAKFGIFFGDQNEYDYLQHMREVGRSINAVLIEAKASTSSSMAKKPEKPTGLITLRETEDNAVEGDEQEEDGGNQRKVRFQLSDDTEEWKSVDGDGDPEENPDVQQILEALEDEAFINEFDDDFVTELDREEDYPSAFIDTRRVRSDSLDGCSDSEEEDDEDGLVWSQRSRNNDRMTNLSGFSMTSSVLHRNAGLTLLDERFDRIYEEYADSDDEEEDFDDDDSEQQGDGNSADEELRRNTEFNRFEDVLDDFLYNTDLKGKHMVHRSGDTLYDVDEIRSALRDLAVDPKRYEQDAANNANDKDGDGDDLVAPEAKQRSEWDCETILSTYTNLENRPKVIRDARQTRQRIALSHKTGLPLGILKPRVADIAAAKIATEQVLDSGSVCNSGRNLGQVRSKEETADEKKQRKAAIKEQKRNRRQEKKSNKLAFKEESKRMAGGPSSSSKTVGII